MQVLQDNGNEAMAYTDIADEISRRQLRSELGATPAQSVAATLSLSLSKDGASSPFVRVGKGEYALRNPKTSKATLGSSSAREAESTAAEEEMGLITSFGMYWQRSAVHWTNKPTLLGRQASSSVNVDFGAQRGVYLLYDSREVVYVGRSTGRDMGPRLYEHTIDRLKTRWDRFSWFGVQRVTAEGKLEDRPSSVYSVDMLIATLEALLIEGVEPRQNRRRGDGFRAVEYLQQESPEIVRNRMEQLVEEFRKKMML